MMSTRIDGSPIGGSSQLFDLLGLISNPDEYNARLKKLQDATAENKKYVELVAPAADILDLQEKARKDREEASMALRAANEQAKKIMQEASMAVANMIKSAQADADKMIAEAKAINTEAKSKVAELNKQIAAAKDAQDAADANAKSLAAQTSALDKQIAAAKKAKADAEAEKNALVKKHEAFLESLA